METKIKKFLEFNGKVIYFVAVDGIYWIAIRPICEALNIQFSRILKNIKEDEILKDVWSKQTMRDTKNRLQNMVALPEKYIYGWLFSIRSGSDAFQEYKRKCYDILFEYFHGSITGRLEVLIEKSDALTKIDELVNELHSDPRFIQLNNERAKVMRLGKQLKALDEDFITGQLSLNFKSPN
jgi:hypothetical protein